MDLQVVRKKIIEFLCELAHLGTTHNISNKTFSCHKNLLYFPKRRQNATNTIYPGGFIYTLNNRTIKIAAFAIGFYGMLSQTIIFRELAANLHTNELLITIFLVLWLISAALGSIAFRRHTKGIIPIGIAFFSYPTIAPIVVRWGTKLAIGSIGVIPSLGDVVTVSAMAVVPIALSGGMLFAILAQKTSEPRMIYSLEGFGAMTGGAVALLLLSIIPPLAMLGIFSTLSFGVFLFILRPVYAIGALLIMPLLLCERPIASKLTLSLFGADSVSAQESIYERITDARLDNSYYLYRNATLSGFSGDSISAQMWLQPILWGIGRDSLNILFIGGAAQGVAGEAMRHNANSLYLWELDPMYVSTLKRVSKRFRREMEGINIVHGNPEKQIKRLAGYLDLIVISPGKPTTLQENRLWSQSFFHTTYNTMKADGFLACYVSVGQNQLLPSERELVGSLLRTIKDVFPYVEFYYLDGAVLIVAGKGYPMNLGAIMKKTDSLVPLSGLAYSRRVIALQFNALRQKPFLNEIGDAALYQRNTSLKPVGYLLGLLHFERAGGEKILGTIYRKPLFLWLIITAAIVFLLWVAFFAGHRQQKPFGESWAALTGGVWGIGSNLICLTIFQARLGMVYWAFGFLSGLFLMGSALGALSHKRTGISPQAIFIAASILLAVATLSILVLAGLPEWLVFAYVSILSSISGWLIGTLFAALVAKAFSDSPGLLYGLDLIGASTAGILVGFFILPFMGFIAVAIFIGLMLFSAKLLYKEKSKNIL